MSLLSKLLDFIPGLGQIKLSATTVMWIVAFLAFGAVAGTAYVEYKHIATLEADAGKATQQIKDLGNANKALQGQIDLLQKSGKINNTVTNGDVQQKQDATTTTNAISTNTNAAVNTIIQKYQPQGPSQVITPAQQTQESRDLDEANIDGAWQTFCASIPSDKACAQVSAKAAPATAASATDATVGPVASNN
jgi:predicted lactoylglutathione lyase